MSPSGIDPATFWFVAQYLNHCATALLVVFFIMNHQCMVMNDFKECGWD
jgi:hypothetical protein